MQTITIGKVQATVSQNNLYIIKKGDQYRLYIRSDVKAPDTLLLDGEELKYSGATYAAYAYKNKFLRDCLHTAEEVMHKSNLEQGKDRSLVLGSGRIFGQSDQQNIDIAKEMLNQYPQYSNVNANPQPERAYAIVVTAPPNVGNFYPYHAAGVVAIDGNDTVTLEVFARASDAKQRDATGKFEMYTIGDANTSFHAIWSQEPLLNFSPITIMLGPK